MLMAIALIVGCGGESDDTPLSCTKNNNGETVTLSDRQIYDFDSKSIVTSPTSNGNLIQLFKSGSPSGSDEITTGSNIDHGNSSYTSNLSITMRTNKTWSSVFCSDYESENYSINSGKSVYGTGDIFLVRLSDGSTYIKFEIISLEDSLTFYWEYLSSQSSEDDSSNQNDEMVFTGEWNETDGDEGTFTMTFTQTETTFIGTYDVVKETNEGGSYSYTISGTRNGNIYEGTDSRCRTFSFEIDNNTLSGSYYDPNGGETGYLN